MTIPAYAPTEPRRTPPFYKAGLLRASKFRARGNKSDASQGWLLLQRADEAGTAGVYYPETLKSMRMAFDLAWKHVSSIFEDQEKARAIIGRLATSAADDLISVTGASDRPYVQSRGTSTKAYFEGSFAKYDALREV